MKLMIMTDIEGVAGILNFEDWCVPEGRYYDKGKRLLTEEVNAAIDGFYEGGAGEITVIDGHGCGAIDPELLDERVWLSCGHYEHIFPWGLDVSYDALAYVGQHAKAGTPYSQLTHTQGCSFLDMTLNDISIGEYGQLVLCAMELGVPTILACGEQAFAEEAEALTPGVVTVSVKQGLLPDGLDHLDEDAYRSAKLSACHRSPKKARTMIRAGALESIQRLKTDPSSFQYPSLTPPYELNFALRQTKDNAPRTERFEHPDSIIGAMNLPFAQ